MADVPLKATKAIAERIESEERQSLIEFKEADNCTKTDATTKILESNGKPEILRNDSHTSRMGLKLVECRVEFITFGEVDTFNEQFKAHVLVRSRWLEDCIITEYDPKKDWNPKLFVDNAIPEKYYEEIRYKLQQIGDKTEITEIRTCKGTFWERMELQDFPMDIQELSIVMQTKHNPAKVRLIPDTQKISRMNEDTLNSFRDQQKFKLYKMVRTSETASYEGSQNSLNSKSRAESELIKRQPAKSKFVASCFCSRKAGYYITNVYLFNLLITILSLTLFVIDIKNAERRISGTFTLILTTFSFKIVTSKTLPTISYLTSLDQYQFINIVYLGICCVWHSTVVSLNATPDQKYMLDKIAMGALIAFFFTIQIVFALTLARSYRKIRELQKEELSFQQKIASCPYDLEEYDV